MRYRILKAIKCVLNEVEIVHMFQFILVSQRWNQGRGFLRPLNLLVVSLMWSIRVTLKGHICPRM